MNFSTWLAESEDTDVGTADIDEIRSWLTQKFAPRERPIVVFRGTEYQISGEPDMPSARGSFVQARPLHRPTGAPVLIPIRALILAVGS